MVSSCVEIGRLTEWIRALSDDTRLQVVSLLARGECCQCEILNELGTAQPLLSFHLKVLREAGFIRGRRRGRWVFYSLCHQPIAEIEQFLREPIDPV